MGGIAGVPHGRAVRALQKAGFKVLRQGRHIVMVKEGRSLRFRAMILSTPILWAASFAMRDSPLRIFASSCRRSSGAANPETRVKTLASRADPRPFLACSPRLSSASGPGAQKPKQKAIKSASMIAEPAPLEVPSRRHSKNPFVMCTFCRSIVRKPVWKKRSNRLCDVRLGC